MKNKPLHILFTLFYFADLNLSFVTTIKRKIYYALGPCNTKQVAGSCILLPRCRSIICFTCNIKCVEVEADSRVARAKLWKGFVFLMIFFFFFEIL